MNFIKKHPYLSGELLGISLFPAVFIYFLIFGDNASDEFAGIMIIISVFIIVFCPIIFLLSSLFKPKLKNSWLKMRYDKSDILSERNIIYYIYKIALAISVNNDEILSKLRVCFKDPKTYYNMCKTAYENRGIKKFTTAEEIEWLAMVDLLINNNYCCEVDDSIEIEDFIYNLMNLKNIPELDEKMLKTKIKKLKLTSITSWCEVINSILNDNEMCLAAIDINSCSYVIFPCEKEKLNYLATLTKDLYYKIDFAHKI